MKHKSAVILSVGAAGLLLVATLFRFFGLRGTFSVVLPKTITPDAANALNGGDADGDNATDAAAQSFIPLHSTETLVSTTAFDFDGDGFDDQVAAVRKLSSSHIALIVGLYNASANTYARIAEITTEISKSRTFSYSGIDMTGDHRNALVYQGIRTNGDSVLSMYHCSKTEGAARVVNIGTFASNGAIFIQQTERPENYALSQTKGESFSVWVYSSEKEGAPSEAAQSQTQTEYRWSAAKNSYVQSRQIKVAGSTIAAKELARIQNGNIETFSKFLSGLWYKTSGEGREPRYLHFNRETKEVIFLSDETEGVYSWEDSSLRRNGIYITAVNTIIASMKRRFDISLTGINEIYVRVHDNVGMLIKENNQWDGAYRKMSFQSTFGEDKTMPPSKQFVKELLAGPAWIDNSGNRFVFTEDTFTLSGAVQEEGIFAADDIGGAAVIQFRSIAASSALGASYAMHFLPDAETKSDSENSSEKPEGGRNVIVLTPVRLTPSASYPADGYPLALTRDRAGG